VREVNPTYDLSDVSFDIVCAYGNGTDSTTDIVRGVEIIGYGKTLSQGDANMVIEIDFMALKIDEAIQ
jgi:hypothetical protein